MSALLLFLLQLLASCTGGATTPPIGPTACDVELSIQRLDSDADFGPSSYEFQAIATNVTNADVELVLRDRCPDGLAIWDGIPDHDWYGTCADGICDAQPDVVITIPAGASVGLASGTVNAGGDTCNPAPGPLDTEITFALPTTSAPQPTLCGPTPHTFELL